VEGGCTGAKVHVEAAEEGGRGGRGEERGGEGRRGGEEGEGEEERERRGYTKRRCEKARQYRSDFPAYRSLVLRR